MHAFRIRGKPLKPWIRLSAAIAWLLMVGGGKLATASALAEPVFTEEQRALWSLQPMARPAIPAVRTIDEVGNPIDAFLLARLERAGLRPGPESDRVTLIRRVTLDLIGLPPTPTEVEAFVHDDTAEAYERVVDRLLASPRFGERWARHWLDLARYAESEGFKADETRPNAWRYRDYVIRAFNADKPYDRFVQEQIAGDELWPDDPEALVATGFNRHFPDESNARNLVQRRQEILNDITDTVGAVFTGLTYACARCHDHKWDPISQADYYRLQAFFANAAAADAIPLTSTAERQRHAERLAAWQAATREIREEMERLEAPGREAIIRDYVEKYPPEIQAMLAKPAADRSPFEQQMVAKARLYLDPASHQYLASSAASAARLKGAEKARWSELKAQLKRFAHLDPGEEPVATGVTDLGVDCPPTRILRKGNWNLPEDEVEPGFLTVLGRDSRSGRDGISLPSPRSGSSGRRAMLARWLTDPENPLTARVMVNRLWQQHFGRGIAASESDLGLKGERPTHPELLDWLARDFVSHGWSLKHIHRLIVTSSAYRQSSRHRTAAAEVDPGNRLLWCFPRRRLDGEVIRDSLLAVSGRLNLREGGPSVFPPLPAGMGTRGGWKVEEDPLEHDRRSIYVFVRRNTRYPMFEAFDMPDTHESCARRNVTTSPAQALTMLNNAMVLDWARSFAGRVLNQAGESRSRQIETAWRLAWGRLPGEEELVAARNFLTAQRELVRASGSPSESPEASSSDPATLAVLTDLCHGLMNANEFVYLE